MVIVKENAWLLRICALLGSFCDFLLHISSKLAALNLVPKENHLVWLDYILHIHPQDCAFQQAQSEQGTPCLVDMDDFVNLVCLSDVDNAV